MKCPACSANLPDDAADCPGCGINIEAWRARESAPKPAQSGPEETAQKAPGTGFPLFKFLIGVMIVGGLWLGGRAWHRSIGSGPAGIAETADDGTSSADIEAAAPGRAASAAPAPDTGGYDALMGEYAAQAGALGVAVREENVKRFFDLGLQEGQAADFDQLEAAGVSFLTQPFTPEERKEAGKKPVAARCDGPEGTVLLAALPSDNAGYSNCWQRMSGRAKSTRYVHVIYSPVLQKHQWAQAQWLESSKRWSAWTDEQQTAAASVFTERYYGAEAVARERAENERISAKIMNSAANGAEDLSGPLADTYKIRFRREGLLAGIELSRRKTAGTR